MKKQKYSVTGMTCSACSSHVEKSVSKLAGMQEVTVNLLTNSMQVSYDEALCQEELIIAAVEKAGYGAALFVKEGQASAASESNRKATQNAENQAKREA